MENKYSIKAISNITGINVHTIRAWEKRYKAISPDRSDSNRRMYTENDLEKLILLNKAVLIGHSIGSIANHSISSLQSLLNNNQSLLNNKQVGSDKTAKSFRQNILEKAGSEPQMNLYIKFRGKEPGIEALLRQRGLN